MEIEGVKRRRTLKSLRVRGLSRGGGTWAGSTEGELGKAYPAERTAHAGSTGHLAAATQSPTCLEKSGQARER